mmetsp:Transcript_19449/g.14119  ORF Transcript_19449/g.14119 Transcript_19449/m.14119 type:complete len:106 (-) Transcript_19449:268-585(-)
MLSSFGDTYGSLAMMRIAYTGTLAITLSILFIAKSLIVLYVLMFLFGLLFTWRIPAAYVYSQEIVLKTDTKLLGSFLMIFAAFPTFSAAVYFQNVSTEWTYYVLI